MRIQVNDEKKLAVIWMTRADQVDEEQQKELRSLNREYGVKKYTVAVFQSGQEELIPLTSHLLCHNRICAAKVELRREGQKHTAYENGDENHPEQREEKQPYQGPTMIFG